jgi:hypothetical protein
MCQERSAEEMQNEKAVSIVKESIFNSFRA